MSPLPWKPWTEEQKALNRAKLDRVAAVLHRYGITEADSDLVGLRAFVSMAHEASDEVVALTERLGDAKASVDEAVAAIRGLTGGKP